MSRGKITSKIAAVFGRDELRRYIQEQIRKGNLVRIKNRSNQTSELTTPIVAHYEESASDISITKLNQFDIDETFVKRFNCHV